MKTKLAHVWPLIDGLPGFNALNEPVMLMAGTRGLMPLDVALEQESQGNLVLMAGKTPDELYALKRKPGSYQAGEAPPEAEVPAPKRRGRPPGSKTTRYKRRDMTAETPK